MIINLKLFLNLILCALLSVINYKYSINNFFSNFKFIFFKFKKVYWKNSYLLKENKLFFDYVYEGLFGFLFVKYYLNKKYNKLKYYKTENSLLLYKKKYSLSYLRNNFFYNFSKKIIRGCNCIVEIGPGYGVLLSIILNNNNEKLENYYLIDIQSSLEFTKKFLKLNFSNLQVINKKHFKLNRVNIFFYTQKEFNKISKNQKRKTLLIALNSVSETDKKTQNYYFNYLDFFKFSFILMCENNKNNFYNSFDRIFFKRLEDFNLKKFKENDNFFNYKYYLMKKKELHSFLFSMDLKLFKLSKII